MFIAAARGRTEAMDHILLHGPPGLGKTTMAQIISGELGLAFVRPLALSSHGQVTLPHCSQIWPQMTCYLLMRFTGSTRQLKKCCILRWKISSLDLMIGEGPSARSVRIDLPPFTLVGATTRAGLLTTPLRDRFGIQMRMQFYTAEELSVILQAQAVKLNLVMAEDGALEIARRARGTPRIAGRLLRRVRDIATVEGAAVITAEVADKALLRLDVDATGLDQMDRRYLSALADNYGGGPVGLRHLPPFWQNSAICLKE